MTPCNSSVETKKNQKPSAKNPFSWSLTGQRGVPCNCHPQAWILGRNGQNLFYAWVLAGQGSKKHEQEIQLFGDKTGLFTHVFWARNTSDTWAKNPMFSWQSGTFYSCLLSPHSDHQWLVDGFRPFPWPNPLVLVTTMSEGLENIKKQIGCPSATKDISCLRCHTENRKCFLICNFDCLSFVFPCRGITGFCWMQASPICSLLLSDISRHKFFEKRPRFDWVMTKTAWRCPPRTSRSSRASCATSCG